MRNSKHHVMQKFSRVLPILAALTLFAACDKGGPTRPLPAEAASAQLKLLGNLAGMRYCQLRSYGVEHREALHVAMRESAVRGTAQYVTLNGEQYQVGILDMNSYIERNCLNSFPQTY